MNKTVSVLGGVSLLILAVVLSGCSAAGAGGVGSRTTEGTNVDTVTLNWQKPSSITLDSSSTYTIGLLYDRSYAPGVYETNPADYAFVTGPNDTEASAPFTHTATGVTLGLGRIDIPTDHEVDLSAFDSTGSSAVVYSVSQIAVKREWQLEVQQEVFDPGFLEIASTVPNTVNTQAIALLPPAEETQTQTVTYDMAEYMYFEYQNSDGDQQQWWYATADITLTRTAEHYNEYNQTTTTTTWNLPLSQGWNSVIYRETTPPAEEIGEGEVQIPLEGVIREASLNPAAIGTSSTSLSYEYAIGTLSDGTWSQSGSTVEDPDNYGYSGGNYY